MLRKNTSIVTRREILLAGAAAASGGLLGAAGAGESSPASSTRPATTRPTVESFAEMRLGLFVHYMYAGRKLPGGVTVRPDGTIPQSLDDVADNFDAADLVRLARSMRAQYVQFTTWHANMNAMFPSKVLADRLPGHASRRDVIRDLINALRPAGIRLVLYIHPSDGHDFSPEDQQRVGWNDDPPYARWNDFVNEAVAEVVERYGDDVAGYWIDGGLPPQVDPPRLRATIASRRPKAWLIQNSGLNPACVDFGAHESFVEPYPATTWQMNAVLTADWVSSRGFVRICPEFAFQYTVFLAGTKGNAGGVAWAVGPYVGGGWETGVCEFADRLGTYIDRIRPALFGTRPSMAYVTSEGTPFRAVQCIATESQDGATTFLHVLQPPRQPWLQLPPPADGRRFTSAKLLRDGPPIAFSQDAKGLRLTLNAGDSWDPLDTVIVMK